MNSRPDGRTRMALAVLLVAGGCSAGGEPPAPVASAAPVDQPVRAVQRAEPDGSANDITGTVTDEFGVAVHCPVVWLPNGGVANAVQADDAGAFRLSGIAAGAVGTVLAQVDLQHAVSRQPVHAGARDIRLIAKRAKAPIEGRVLGADDAPVSHNWVVYQPAEPPLAPFAKQDGQSAKLGDDGSFTIPAAEGVVYELSLDVGHGLVVIGRVRAGERGVVLHVPEAK